ncbi:MAG: bifunctional adenosylcobinamide kinase/adenosylcobinamide-phosphate guanylyltransferase [Gammaproteobacteria bacterium]|nr:bifunctional adenosylcobinamide kinase/adenosylcobinamide-phosphate guanylyltransferase [Gammaproteobacteria bacterium]
MKQLILGGARSGKSQLAQNLAMASGLPVVYVATAAAGDDEMAQRIAMHRQQRPSGWQVIEEALELESELLRLSGQGFCVLVDCLTLWLSNNLEQPDVHDRITRLVTTVKTYEGILIMVSNEVGQGIVPMGELSRAFVDHAGRLHQQLATTCDRVVVTMAGLPLVLKGRHIEY